MENNVVIYQSNDGLVKMEAIVDAANETIWATQKAMAELFGVTVPNISYHFKRIFASGELDAQTVIKEILITAQSGVRGVSEEKIRYYNLDAILSLGYRVNSVQATAFRKWATSVLKRALGLLENVFGQNLIMAEEQAKELFAVVKDYTYALDTLDAYDYQSLEISDTTLQEKFHATYESAMDAIQSLKEKFKESRLFGVEKDKSFHSSIGQIYQTWDGQELYPSVEEKAAMLLYLVVKNHSFVALTLLIAESRMDEMDILVKVVVNLINRKQ